MEYIIGELGVGCIILAPFFLTLGVGGFIFEKALDRFPRFCYFLERVFDVDLGSGYYEEG